MNHREAAVCIIQGVENIEISLCSIVKHLTYFQRLGYVSQEEYNNACSIVLRLMNEIYTELAEPAMEDHPGLITRCGTGSVETVPDATNEELLTELRGVDI